ncbi:MAG: DUF4976 domain-containing protein, partial [Phycisphaeraceae bacterium]|nr:DUF4976 domain-containing protein [Phycisphaeraceae bacterium]
PWVLYDLANDPYELNNLVDDPAYADRLAEMRNRLRALRRKYGDDLPLEGEPFEPVRLPA